MNLWRIPQLVGYWRLRHRRIGTFRGALVELSRKTQAFTWWWDEVNAQGFRAGREGKVDEVLWWRAQKDLMEWLLNRSEERRVG